MRKILASILFIASLSLSDHSIAIDLKFEREVADLARHICSSELKKGSDYDTEVYANGDVGFKLLGPKGGNINGSFRYSEGAWEEQQKVLVKDQAKRDEQHEKCVTTQIDRLRNAHIKKK